MQVYKPVFNILANLLKIINCSGVTHNSAAALYAACFTVSEPSLMHFAKAKASGSKRVYPPSLPACNRKLVKYLCNY